MRRSTHCVISLAVVMFVMSVAALGQAQSLGDIARENREKKAAQESSSTPPRVITNKTLSKDPDASAHEAASAPPSTSKTDSPFNEKTAARSSDEQSSTEHGPAERPSIVHNPTDRQLAEQHAARQRTNERRAADQWKRKILQQEATVANLRMRVDRLRASIHFTNVSTYNDMPFNRYQARQAERLRQVQQQLGEQQRKLEDMQEAARHAGMHTVVYDP
jgi:hypothetical protein